MIGLEKVGIKCEPSIEPDTDVMDELAKLDTCSNILELAMCVEEHGWSPQLEYLFGEELSNIGIDTNTDITDITSALYAIIGTESLSSEFIDNLEKYKSQIKKIFKNIKIIKTIKKVVSIHDGNMLDRNIRISAGHIPKLQSIINSRDPRGEWATEFIFFKKRCLGEAYTKLEKFYSLKSEHVFKSDKDVIKFIKSHSTNVDMVIKFVKKFQLDFDNLINTKYRLMAKKNIEGIDIKQAAVIEKRFFYLAVRTYINNLKDCVSLLESVQSK